MSAMLKGETFVLVRVILLETSEKASIEHNNKSRINGEQKECGKLGQKCDHTRINRSVIRKITRKTDLFEREKTPSSKIMLT